MVANLQVPYLESAVVSRSIATDLIFDFHPLIVRHM